MNQMIPRPTRLNRYEKSVRILFESPEADADFIKQCFWELKAQFDGAAAKMNKWLIWGVTAVVAFELLNRRLINSASTWFIELSRLSFLIYVMPILASLALLNVMVLSLEGLNYVALIDAFTEKAYKNLYESSIYLLFTSNAGFFGASMPSSICGKLGYRSFSILGYGQAFLYFIGYTVFEIYAYIQLFRHGGATNMATIFSLLASLGLLALAIVFVVSILELPETASVPK
jgi:hypothetical protein